MDTLSIVGSICSITSLIIALFVAEHVIKINKKVNNIISKKVKKDNLRDDKSQNVDMQNFETGGDLVLGNKKEETTTR